MIRLTAIDSEEGQKVVLFNPNHILCAEGVENASRLTFTNGATVDVTDSLEQIEALVTNWTKETHR